MAGIVDLIPQVYLTADLTDLNYDLLKTTFLFPDIAHRFEIHYEDNKRGVAVHVDYIPRAKELLPHLADCNWIRWYHGPRFIVGERGR